MNYCWLTTRFKQVMHTLQLRDDMTLTALQVLPACKVSPVVPEAVSCRTTLSGIKCDRLSYGCADHGKLLLHNNALLFVQESGILQEITLNILLGVMTATQPLCSVAVEAG
eukprot:jgi/Chrzof1/14359/UNPLg00633.t1